MFITCRQLRQSVKMCAGSAEYLVVSNVSVAWMAMSSALKLVWNPGSLRDIRTSSFDGL